MVMEEAVLAPESEPDLKLVHGCKTCQQATVGVPSTHHVAASILHRICPIAFFLTGADLSYPTPHPSARYLGHRGSSTQREAGTMNEGPSHLSFPSWTSLVLALSVTLPRGRQKQAVIAMTSCAFYCPCSLFSAQTHLRASL